MKVLLILGLMCGMGVSKCTINTAYAGWTGVLTHNVEFKKQAPCEQYLSPEKCIFVDKSIDRETADVIDEVFVPNSTKIAAKAAAKAEKKQAKADALQRIKDADIPSMNSVPELRQVIEDMKKYLNLEN